MTRNMAGLDRGIRALLGAIALVVALVGVVPLGWSWAIGIVGAVLLVTAAAGFCPLYTLFGVRTGRNVRRDA
ncbi:MAG: DUF2892 domain-containing protein [Trueperaceae bacterium]|nr:DUF2892 domain-containing protein [Trueperaceae bacterium]